MSQPNLGRTAALLLALLWGGQAGCVVLPFATPPMEIAAAPGLSAGTPPPPTRWQGMGQPGVTTLQAALYPMGLDPKLFEREVDIGVGGLIDLGPQGASVYGPYMEARAYPHTWLDRPELHTIYRLSVCASAQALREPDSRWGAGFSVGVGVEVSHFTSGPFGSSDPSGSVIGVAHGEVGGGVDLMLSARQVEDYHWTALQLRFRGRLPGSAGLIFIPLSY